jgi:hypothetical protein
MRTKLTVVIKENKSKEPQQLDEIWGNILHSYKWLGPLHDILNMSDPEDKGLFKGILKWYQNNETTQTLGNMVASFEKLMNKAWESGAAGKSAALTVQGLLSGGDVVTSQISAGVGYILRNQRDEMVAEKLAIAEKAAADIQAAKEKAEKESQGAIAIAKVPELEAIINQLKADLRQKDIERAKQLFAASEDLKEKTKLLPPSQLTRGSQEKMYKPPVKEGKKMTKKYSSYSQQQTITENFRKFIGEIRVEDQIGTSTNRLTITNKEDILAAIKEYYPDGISRHAEVIVDFTGLNNEAIWQELNKVGLVAHLSREIPNQQDSSIIQSQVEVWLDNRHYDDEDGEIAESKKAKKVTKSQLTKIIAEEIRKILNEASKPETKPEWMDEYDWETIKAATQEKYDKFFAPIIAQRAKEDEGSAAAGLAKAEELEQEFLNDPKIADLGLGAYTETRPDGLWVGLPSENNPENNEPEKITMSSNGLETSNRLHSKLIYSDWHPTREFDKKGWVKVVKRRKEKP